MSCIKSRFSDSSSTSHGSMLVLRDIFAAGMELQAVESNLTVTGLRTAVDSRVSRVKLQKYVLIKVFLSA